MNARLIAGSLLFAASTLLFAQTPTAPDSKKGGSMGEHHRMRACSQEPDPAKCEARRKEMREHMSKAREACKGKTDAERGQCMSTEMCAKAPDPAKCAAHAKERKEHRHEMREKGGPKT